MTKLKQLVRQAREAATAREHEMQPFTHTSKTTAHSYCAKGCGMGVFVDSKPAPNGIDIHGRAVAMNCDAGPKLDAHEIMVAAHEELCYQQLAGLPSSARQKLEAAIGLMWDARKHLQGQKLTEPGLYADKLFAE